MSEYEKQNNVKSSNQVSRYVLFEGEEGGNPKIMFVGNSITRHAPSPEIGWLSDCGMAASKLENDYVHLVMARTLEKYPKASFCIVQAAHWERSYLDFNFDENFSSAKSFKPDVIICTISENIPEDMFEKESFAQKLYELHTYLKGGNENCAVIEGSNFFSSGKKDEGIKLYAEKYGAHYVDLSDLIKDDINLAKGLFEHRGIQIHPGDTGMRAIADRYIDKLKGILSL